MSIKTELQAALAYVNAKLTAKGAEAASTVYGIGDCIEDIQTGIEPEEIEFSQINQSVAEYMNTDYSSDPNRTVSAVDSYAPDGNTEADRRDIPLGATVDTADGSLNTVDLAANRSTAQSVSSGEKRVYNITPSQSGGLFALTKSGAVKAFGALKPTGQVRMLYTPSVINVRDLGGWACDGGTVKYGKLFRGGAVASSQGITLSAADKKVYNELIGIGCELDFTAAYDKPSGGLSQSPFGAEVEYIPYPTELMYYALLDYDGAGRAIVKSTMEKVFENAKRNIPTYFHCVYGKDRTGTIALLIEALLGVSEEDCDKDYELSSFTLPSASYRRYRTDNRWKEMIAYLKSTTNGSTLRDAAVAYCVLIGLDINAINAFRASMIDGNPQPVTADIDYSGKTVTLSDSSVSVPAGTSRIISATVSPSWATEAVVWSSSAPSAVSVTGSGNLATVTAIGSGSATVTATLNNGQTASCEVIIAAPPYTNQIPISTDENGNTYNVTGYKNGYRLNSSGNEVSDSLSEASVVTGFIPVSAGDVIRFAGEFICGEAGAENTWFYKSDRTRANVTNINPVKFKNGDSAISVFQPYNYDTANGRLLSFTVPADNSVAYIRCSLHASSGANAVITVNELIDQE